MKRLNIKLLSILSIAFLVVMGSVYAVHGIQMKRNVYSLIKRAEDNKESDPANAIWLYRRYLQYQPDDQERNADYAQLVSDQAKITGDERLYMESIDALQKAMLNTDRPELKRKLIDLKMAFRQYPDAREDLLDLKKKGKADAHDLLQLAQCYIGTVHYLDAVKLFEELIGYDPATKKFDASKATAPHELDAYYTLAMLLRDKVTDAEMAGHAELADRVVDQMVVANPDSAKAYLFQAQFLLTPKNRDRATAAIKKAQELAPEDVNVLLVSAQMALQANDIAGAEQLINKGIKLFPKDERFYLLWAGAAQQQRNYTEAKHRLDEGLTAIPSNLNLLRLYFDIQLQDKDYDGARSTLKKLSNNKLRPELQDLYSAKIAVAEGKYREARQQLEQVRASLGKVPQFSREIDQLLMQCYNALNQPDQALKVASSLADTPEGLLNMAASQAAIGKTSEAIKNFEKIAAFLEQTKNTKAMPQVLRNILELRMIEEARKPKDQRNWAIVDGLFAKIRDQNMLGEPATSLLQARILARKGEDEKSHQLMKDLVKQYPSDANVIGSAVGLALQQHQPAEALQIIAAAPEEIRSQPRFVVNRLDALFVAGGSTDELKSGLAAIVRDVEKLPKQQRYDLYPNLGGAYIRLGDLQSAKALWDHAAEEDPKDPRIHLLQFDLARDMGDMATMKKIQEWFEKDYNDDPIETKLIQAAVMVSGVQQELRDKHTEGDQIVLDDAQSRTLLRARDLLREIGQARPGWVETPKWLAQIDMLEGKTDEAIEDLRQVLDLGQPNTEVIKTLVRLLYARHRNDEAIAVIDANSSLIAGDAEMDRIQAQLQLTAGQPKAALELMEKTHRFSDDSTNPMEHLLHGQLLLGAGNIPQAEKEIRKTIELNPEIPQAWTELIRLKMIDKKPEEALQILQEAHIKVPEDQRAIVMAQGSEMLGDQVQAEQNYLTALAAMPKNLQLLQNISEYYLRTNRPQQAIKYLNQMTAETPSQPGERDNYDWARRTTARLLATGSYQQFQKALELLTPANGKPSIEDLTARITILFDRGDPSSSRQALRLFDELKQLRPLTWQERFVLARLYDRIGDWTSARAEISSLLSQPKADPIIYTTFIKMLLQHGSPDEALTWLKSLESLGNQDKTELTFLAAAVLNALDRGPQAAAQLVKLLPTERPMPKEQWPLLRRVAAELEQIGQYDQAEMLLREDVSYEPQQGPMLAAFYARRGKVDSALNLLEQNRKSIPTPTLLQIAMAALRQNITPPTPQQVQRVEQWFDRALQEDPDSWVLQLVSSDLRDYQHKYDEAEKLYRGLLARSDLPPTERSVVLNNLAFLLAMQGRDRDEAIKFIDEAIKTFGPQSDMLDTRGIIYLSKGDVEQAVADLSDAVVSADPKAVQFVHLAMAQSKAKDDAGARKSLERAKQLKFNPDDLSPVEKTMYQALLKQLNIAA